MGLEKNDNVRAVERAIELLEALNRRPLSTLGELQHDTGLPKSSIVRLLRTLEAKGLVAQTASYGSYRLLGPVRSLSSGRYRQPLIVEVTEEIMIEFTRREGWPLALALFDTDAMVVSASTIPYTSFACVYSSLNIRLSLVDHALGLAFLAHCSAAEQKALLGIVQQDLDPKEELKNNLRTITAILKQVRAGGYAERARFLHSQTSTLAVPVFQDGRLAASLGITWLAAGKSMHDAIKQFVPQLKAMAHLVADQLDQLSTATHALSHLDLHAEQNPRAKPALSSL